MADSTESGRIGRGRSKIENAKVEALDAQVEVGADQLLTTNQGLESQ